MGDPLLTLPELIRRVRGARTQAVERELVQRECARIRGAIRAGDPQAGTANLTKLLYIHLLGYPAHFGQVREPRPAIPQNPTAPQAPISPTALPGTPHCTLISPMPDIPHCTPDLLLPLCTPIFPTAVACAVHIVRKVPELSDVFVPVCDRLLKERRHGLLHVTLLLITEMCERSPDVLSHFRKVREPRSLGSQHPPALTTSPHSPPRARREPRSPGLQHPLL
uniref:Adaptor related protein complex 1 subunit gamma 2 n=1 Tax=Chrysemys picta bellii TaxID=8478 RepID=A0A8C3IQQ0_CHRPI